MKKFLIILVLLLGACQPKTNIPISIDETQTYFEGMGLTCGESQTASQTSEEQVYPSITCKGTFPEDRISVWVDIFVRKNARHLSLITAQVEQKGDDPSKEINIKYLSQIAALPFEGNTPDKATLWLHLNYDKAMETQAGGATPSEIFGGGQFALRVTTDFAASLTIQGIRGD